MIKSITLTILLALIVSSCSIKNPLSKKNSIIFLDCPKSLILGPGSRLYGSNSLFTLTKEYSISCYYYENNPNNILFDLNYNIEVVYQLSENQEYLIDFWTFITDKKETKKISKHKFTKNISLNESDEKITSNLNFKDQINIKKEDYFNGLKVFISLN